MKKPTKSEKLVRVDNSTKPWKMTQTVLNRFFDGIAMFLPYKDAAVRAGIAPRTVGYWLAQGYKDLEEDYESSSPCALFVKRYHENISDLKSSCFAIMKEAANKKDANSWRVAKALLGMRFREEYGNAKNSDNYNTEADGIPLLEIREPVIITSQDAARFNVEQRQEIFRRVRIQTGQSPEIHNYDENENPVDVDLWEAERIKEEEMGDIDLSDL